MDNAKPMTSVGRCNMEHLFVIVSSPEVIFNEFFQQHIREERLGGYDQSALDPIVSPSYACSECCMPHEYCTCHREGQ